MRIHAGKTRISHGLNDAVRSKPAATSTLITVNQRGRIRAAPVMFAVASTNIAAIRIANTRMSEVPNCGNWRA